MMKQGEDGASSYLSGMGILSKEAYGLREQCISEQHTTKLYTNEKLEATKTNLPS